MELVIKIFVDFTIFMLILPGLYYLAKKLNYNDMILICLILLTISFLFNLIYPDLRTLNVLSDGTIILILIVIFFRKLLEN